ncbi:PAS domain S-box-containing protein [Paenibacillus sp. DS2015]|uniref:sensor histidine kinase n=1 Tax=Paenibacillus sp. DS2015 TaxID=3373917 RepID=UPI003D2358AC
MNSLSNSDTTTWSIDKTINRLSMSAGFMRWTGCSGEEIYHRPNFLQEMVYTEDIHIFNKHMDKLYAGRTNSIEHRIFNQKNGLRWVQSIGIPVLNEDNEVYRIDGVVLDITEKRAAQEHLASTVSLYQEMLDKIDVAIWSYDIVSKKVSFISDAITKITGYSVEEAKGLHLWSDIAHQEDKSLTDKIIVSARKGMPNLSEYRIVHSNGELRWIQVRIISSLDKSQKVVRLDGMVADITARKVLEEALCRSEQRYKSLFECNSDVVCELDLHGNILAINPAAEKITGEQLNVAEEGHTMMDVFGAEHTGVMTDCFEKSIAGHAQHYAVQSVHKDGRIIYWDMKNIPIQVNDQIVGAFTIAKDVTVNREVEKRLAEREAEYRLITDNMKDLMVVLDSDGNFIVASPSCEKIMGIPLELIKDTTILEYIHQDDRQFMIDQVVDMLQTKRSKLLRMRFVQANGHIIHLESMGTPVFGDDGEMENIVILSRDITKKVEIENELRESEERYRRLIELSPQPMISHRQGEMVYINPAGMHLLGATQTDELMGKSIYDFIHSDYSERALSSWWQLADKNYIGAEEYKIIPLDGQIIETEIIGIYDDITEMTLILITNVTERLKMERALQESEERYRRLVELSPVAIAVYKESKISYINPAGAKILGVELKKDTLVTNLMEWIHPDYRESVRVAMDNTLLNGYSLPAEYQVVRSDGCVINVSMLSIYDSHSSSIQLMFEDITEKKQVEQALLESEELSGRLIELSPEAIVLHSDYKFIYVNFAGLELFGVSSLSELVGKSIFDCVHPDYTMMVKERLGETIYKQQKFATLVEQKVIRADGLIIDVEVVASTIPYKGKNAGISIFRDIRDRKRAEEDRKVTEQVIRESEERYFRLQTSLDHFSHDLFGVMKISQMEQRLLKEVRDILEVSNVSIIEVEHNRDKLCEIIETDKGYSLKIDENKEKSYILCIDEKPLGLKITSIRVWLVTLTRYVNVLFDNFLIIEDLTKQLEHVGSEQVTPTWLLRFMFNLSENERKHLAQDLHDSALQEQIIWYRKLDLLLTDRSINGALKEQLGQISEGLLDVVYQLRITCNELRPPMLIRDGLISSLEALFEFTQLRSDYSIQFEANNLGHKLNEDQLIGLYRIVQELLANATKHSCATKVQILFAGQDEYIRLEYEDNGIGMDVTRTENSYKSMGIYGIRERVRSMNGTIKFISSNNNGLAIFIAIPLSNRYVTENYMI